MFNYTNLRNILSEAPFRPFRIQMTDGRHFDVAHPENAFLTTNFIEVGTNFNSDGQPQDGIRCAILHIVRVEPITAESKQAA